MTQVFQTILPNAMKYRSDRPLTIGLHAASKGHFCERATPDIGMGIPTESQVGVFTAFTRLTIPGSGIGVALGKTFVQIHDRDIGCRWQVVVGTTFWFTLPLALPQESAITVS